MAPTPPPTTTLLDWLAARYPAAKRQTLRRMLQAGRVTLNGRRVVRASQPLGAEDKVVVTDEPDPRRASAAAPPPPRVRPEFEIIYEDADVLVVDKPPGLLTSTVPREPRPTLLAMVRAHVEAAGPARSRAERVGLIHRLDRDASGLLVFSKTHDAYVSLKRQFFEHSVERTYTAVAEGVPTPRGGRVESRLVERADGTVYSTRRPGEGERAVTDYEVVEERNRRSLIRVTLHTGRKHQIRVHLSQRGAPIVGDTMYRRPDEAPPNHPAKRPAKRPAKQPAAGRLMLAATRLAITHPRTGRRMTFERPAPEGFAAALGAAAGSSR